MDFLNRAAEWARLQALVEQPAGGLAVVYGRRRIGKTRLLTEFAAAHQGAYFVADRSAAALQRANLANAIGQRLPGFGEVTYESWRALFGRLARDAKQAGWRGPLIIDELPYLVPDSPEIASVLQWFVDHDGQDAGLVLAIAGSSQRMMQGMVLNGDAPLYGRALQVMKIRALEIGELAEALALSRARKIVEHYAAWGGVPHYWRLARATPGTLTERLDALVLSPLGPLHEEPDRLLMEELPPAPEVRPVLDAIGLGAHRASEIAGRMGRPATSLSKLLKRLQTLDLVVREIPFGDPPKGGKRALYKIGDSFLRLWFRVVSPNRSALTAGSPAVRRAILAQHWPALVSAAWEALCRARADKLAVAERDDWLPASRWWQGNAPEWDVVSATVDRRHVLLGEVKWRENDEPFTRDELRGLAARALSRTPPALGRKYARADVHRVLFVPRVTRRIGQIDGVHVVTAADIVR